jgi:hypothetical protein
VENCAPDGSDPGRGDVAGLDGQTDPGLGTDWKETDFLCGRPVRYVIEFGLIVNSVFSPWYPRYKWIHGRYNI